MKPVSLTLRGFIGIYKGMGLEEITLDLSDLSGLIAFDAPNGSGKSSILENLQPYRRLASRDGSLQHHVYLRDSYKDFTFDLAGHRYRTLVKIDAQSGRQEGYVWKNETPQVSGKATEYDKYIEGLLGSPKLFFQSVFAAQNGDSLADMTTGELKGLFTEFLRLDKLSEYEETAKLAGNAIKEKIDGIQNRVDAADEKTAGLNQLQSELSEAGQNLSYKAVQAEEYRTAINEVQAELEKAKEAAAEHRNSMQKDAELASQKQTEESKLEEKQVEWTREKTRLEKQIADIQAQIDEKKVLLANQGQHEALRSEMKRLEMAITDKERDLEAVRKELDAAETEIEAMDKAWKQYDESASADMAAQVSYINQLEKEKQGINDKLSDINNEIYLLENDTGTVRLQSKMSELQSIAGKLDERDPECRSETCVFILDAIKARKELPEVQGEYKQHVAEVKARIAEKSNQQDQVKEDLSELENTIKNADERRNQLLEEYTQKQKQHEAEVAELKRRREQSKKDGAEIEQVLSENKRRHAEIRKQLEDAPNYEMVESEIQNLEARLSEANDTLQQRKAEHEKAVREIWDRIAGIDKQRLNLPVNYEAAETVNNKAGELERTQAKASELQESVNQMQSRIAVLNHQISELTEIEDQAAADREKIKQLSEELSQWRYIQQACGKDGLRALEIDGTAPLIAGYANDLLTNTFGPGATVGFRTVNDDGKECLDVVVYREDDIDGNGTLLENLSGGQKVWILKSLRLALTLVAKEKSGKDVSVAMADEEDGALDAESARSFIDMYRQFLSAGNFESILYITHRDSCKAMADHVIRLTRAGIEIDAGTSRAA